MGISDSLILAVGGAIEKAFWEDTQVYWAIEYGRPFTDETRNALARAAIAAARPTIEAEAFEKVFKKARGTNADLCKTPSEAYRVMLAAIRALIEPQS